VEIVRGILFVYWVIILIRVILSYFPAPASTIVRTLEKVVFALTEPVLAPLRRIIPPLRLGGMAMDLSPMIVILLLAVLSARL
jgi:YggT family protein